jgi:hypothetical protein
MNEEWKKKEGKSERESVEKVREETKESDRNRAEE